MSDEDAGVVTRYTTTWYPNSMFDAETEALAKALWLAMFGPDAVEPPTKAPDDRP